MREVHLVCKRVSHRRVAFLNLNLAPVIPATAANVKWSRLECATDYWGKHTFGRLILVFACSMLREF